MSTENQYRTSLLIIHTYVHTYYIASLPMLFTDGWQSSANCNTKWNQSKKPEHYIKLHTYMQRININVTCKWLQVNLSVITTRVHLGTRWSAVGIFTAGYAMTTIQQLLKEEHIIVMKRNLHYLLHYLHANC